MRAKIIEVGVVGKGGLCTEQSVQIPNSILRIELSLTAIGSSNV